MNQKIFLFYPRKFLAPQLPFMLPTVITHCFPWFFLLSPCHRTLVSSIRWETTQLFLWMAAMFLFCFLLTLLSSLILFLLYLDKEVIYSYLWSQIFLLVFYYSFPITHSDYFIPLLEVHQRHPNVLGKKVQNPHHSQQGPVGSGLCLPLWLPLSPSLLFIHSTCATWDFSLCPGQASCFWPFDFLVLTFPAPLWSADPIFSSVKKISLARLRKVSFGYRFSHLPDHILLKNNNYLHFLYLCVSPIRTCW